MKKNIIKTLGIVVLVLALILVGNCLYTVASLAALSISKANRVCT